MTYQKPRAALHAYLTQAAHNTIQNYADEHGVSVTALLQALAEELQFEIDASGYDVRLDWARRARKVDVGRRSRSKGKATAS
jgi:hypothetical protein